MPGTDSETSDAAADPDSGASGDSRERIMRATYRALCAHGYASLTMQDIADESDLSKAALHYHFDSKADLLQAFLSYLTDSFRERVTEETECEGGPFERVRTLVGLLFEPPEENRGAEFRTAILEMKAQAPYEPPVRERLAAFDEFLRAEIADGLDDAREAGIVRADVDPDAVAEFVVTVSNGAHARQVALGRPTDCAETHLMEYLTTLRAGGER
jgi:AcrR family transcriptional regulator